MLENGQGGKAVDGHQQVRFGEQASQNMNDALGAIQSKTINIRTSDAYSTGSHRQSLHDIAAGTNTRVEQDRDPAASLYDGGQQIDGRDAPVRLPSPWLEQ